MKFTKRRQAWAGVRKAPAVKGLPLKPSAAVSARYSAAMQGLIAPMIRDYERTLKRLGSVNTGDRAMDANLGSQARIMLNQLSEKWFARFRSDANAIVDKMVSQTDKAATLALGASLKQLSGGLTIKQPAMPQKLADKVAASAAANVALIKSIPEEFHNKIAGVVLRSIQEGGSGRSDIFNSALENISLEGEKAVKRAKLIANLETSKLSSTIQTDRMEAVGVQRVEWRHSGGGAEPRQLHLEYDGKIFDLDDPPIIDERTGQRGWGGELWNCKCFRVPVFDFSS